MTLNKLYLNLSLSSRWNIQKPSVDDMFYKMAPRTGVLEHLDNNTEKGH